jgi:hypothetical protein
MEFAAGFGAAGGAVKEGASEDCGGRVVTCCEFFCEGA